jgi:omega-amidase
MLISLLQYPIVWADKLKNLQLAEERIAFLQGKTDLVVLPEMFTTGFCTNQPELAEPSDGKTILTVQNWASKYNVAICGSFIATEEGKFYNRSFFVFPDGKAEFEDKRHLFSMGGEDQFFSSGNKPLIVNYGGMNIRLLVCYDVRFPVWSRNVDNQYDLLIYVANFPARRINDWDVLLRARAIENQSFVCGLNITGEDANGISYNGHSVLLDYRATELISFSENEEQTKTFEIHTEGLQLYRQKFPVWKDADRFSV